MVRPLRVNNALRCRELLCEGRTFVLDYTYSGQSRQVKQQIVDMAVNGSGIRDTARVLHLLYQYSHEQTEKKGSSLQQVNQAVLQQLNKRASGGGYSSG